MENFGDGMSDTGPTATHTYAASGSYMVTLTVTDSAGVTGTQTRTLNVNLAPTAEFTYACSEWQCTFDGSGSLDSDGVIANYFWTFGDGAGNLCVRARGQSRPRR